MTHTQAETREERLARAAREREERKLLEETAHVIDGLSNFVNVGSNISRQEAAAKQIAWQHRTIQTMLLRFFLYCIRELAATPDNRVDPRNEKAVAIAKEIMVVANPDKITLI